MIAPLIFIYMLAVHVIGGIDGEIDKPKKQIHIAALIPYLQNHDGFCFKSAMKVAVDLINKDDSILKDYELVINYNDASTMIGFTYLRFYQIINSLPVKQVLIGPAFSTITKAVAKLATFYNMPQISYGALAKLEDEVMSSFSLNEKKINRLLKTYPFFLRTTTSMNSFLASKIKLFKHYGWKRIAILYEYSTTEFFTAANGLASLVQANDMDLLSVQGFFDLYLDAEVSMNKLQEKDARIIVSFLGSAGARKIFCEAYRRNMFGPKYQWVLFYGLPFDWYEDINYRDQNNCTKEQYLEVSNNFITIARSPLRSDGKKTVANLTSPQIWDLIKTYKDEEWRLYYKRLWNNDTTPPIMPASEYYVESTFAFDAVYLTALALNKTTQWGGIKECAAENKTANSNVPLEECYKNDAKVSLGIVDAMLETKFQGVTGHFSFDYMSENRIGEVLIRQFKAVENYSKGIFDDIGYYSDFENEITFYDGDGSSVFKDRQIIKDGTSINLIPRTYSTTLTVVLFSLTGVGLLLSIFVLALNIHYRDVRLIKMSSPSINNGIITGCIICYISVFLYGLDSRWIHYTNIPYACNAVVITLSIGFTLSFGCLFSKTWRIYKVFTAAKTMERVAIKDSHLYGIIFVLIGIDVVMFTLWLTISPFHVELHELESFTVDDVTNKYFYYKCSCEYQLPFTVAMYVYKGILLIFGIFLAWETRHVKIAVLNDSKYIGMAVYNVCVVSAVGVVCTTALYNTKYYSSGYLLVTLSVFICTTGTLLLIFVPKIYMLFGKTCDTTYGSFYSRSVSTVSSNTRSTIKTKSSSDSRYSYNSESSSSFEKSPFSFSNRDSSVYAPSRTVRLDSTFNGFTNGQNGTVTA